MKSIEESSRTLAVVSLQMEDRIEEIRVQEDDDIDLIVDLFCQRYNLGKNCHEYLVDQITQKLKREHSPQFGENRMQANKQSEYQLTTQASSIDENQSTAQKSYEMWQKKLNQKLNSEPTVQWQTSSSPKCINSNKLAYFNNTSKVITSGERMYRDALDQQKYKKEKAEFVQSQRNEKEKQQATFKPAISPRSREIVEFKKKSIQDTSSINIGEQLFQKGVKLFEKKQQLKAQYEENEKKLSPFQPRRYDIGGRNKSAHSQSRSQPKNNNQVFEKLFNQNKDDQKKKNEYLQKEFKKIYPFQPQTNRNYQITDAYQQKLVEKLHKEQKERNTKIEDIKRESQKQQSTYSTFQPSINKDSNAYKKVSKRIDYEDTLLAQDLYKVHQKLNNKSVSSITQISDTGIQYNNNCGQRLLDENIKKIFAKLDGDKDGYIDKNNVNLSAIDVSLLELVSEALYKIEAEEITANQTQFKDICLSVGLGSKLDSRIFKI